MAAIDAERCLEAKGSNFHVWKVVVRRRDGGDPWRSSTLDEITILTDATFDEVVGVADKRILIDFWAEWCGPGKLIVPILEELAVEQSDKFTIGESDVYVG